MKNNKIFIQLILLYILSTMSCSSENKTEQAVSDLLPFFAKEINEEAKIYSSNKYIIDSIQDQKTSFYDLCVDYQDDEEARLLKLKNVVSSRVYDSLYIASLNLQKIQNKLRRKIQEQKEHSRKALLTHVKNYLKSNSITNDVEVEGVIKHLKKQLSDELVNGEFPISYSTYDGSLTINE